MSPRLALARPHGSIFRVARRPDAWTWPDWASAHEDGTFGSRYDDARGEYRVLYASSHREGAFAETLARFRVDLQVFAELRLIDGDTEDEGFPDSVPAGVVPAERIETRVIGTATHDGDFVDVGQSDSIAKLRDHRTQARPRRPNHLRTAHQASPRRLTTLRGPSGSRL